MTNNILGDSFSYFTLLLFCGLMMMIWCAFVAIFYPVRWVDGRITKRGTAL